MNSDGSAEQVVSALGSWKSLALSRDGTKLALTRTAMDTTIYVLNLVDPTASKAILLATPGTLFADALDCNSDGRYVLYDAFQRVPQSNGSMREYWEVSVVSVISDVIHTILPAPEDLSINNPAFSQNNDGFGVFDFVDYDRGAAALAVTNLYTFDSGLIEENGASLGVAHFSTDNRRLVFQRLVNGVATLRQIPIDKKNLKATGPSDEYVGGGQLAIWFAVGERPTEVEDRTGPGPAGFALEQNYPNPFTPLDNLSRGHSPLGGILSKGVNPETNVRYELPQEGNVTLAVFDLAGRRIAIIESGMKTGGQHLVCWDGRNSAGNRVPSGVYFYRLETTTSTGAATTLTKKLTVVK